MGTVPPTLDPAERLSTAIERVQRRPSLLWPVGRPVRGVVALKDFDAVPAHAWGTTTVGEVARPAGDVLVASDEPIDRVLERIVDAPDHMLVVVDAGEPVGLITPSLLMEPT
jgi:hypothetical protein